MATEGRSPEFEEAKKLLLEWLAFAVTTKRRKSSREGATELTTRFFPLEAGLALELMGDHGAADSVWTSLDPRDECESAMERLYELRREHYRNRRHDPGWPSNGMDELFVSLTSFNRYQVERLIEISVLLSPFVRISAATRFYAREGHQPAASEWMMRFVKSDSASGLVETNDGLAHARAFHPFRGAILQAVGSGLGQLGAMLPAIREAWVGVTDTLSTNDHYCAKAIEAFSTVAFAIAQAVNPIPLLDSPPAAMS